MIRKLFLSCFTLFICLNIFSQNQFDSLGMKQGLWLITESYDSIFEYYPISYVYYINDTITGTIEKYDMDSVLRFEVSTLNGLKNGPAKIYDQKGKLKVIANYCRDSILSTIWFDKRGRIVAIYEFNELMRFHGVNTIFYKNQKVLVKSYYKNGFTVKFKSFYKNGKISSTTQTDSSGKSTTLFYNRKGKLMNY